MARFIIKTYTIQIENRGAPSAYIMLSDTDLISTATFRTRLNFKQLPETNTFSMTQSGNFIEVNMNYKSFASVVDMLRNEKPLTFNWFTPNNICIISSSEEPVGEGEVQRS